jgi:hypothetical protein
MIKFLTVGIHAVTWYQRPGYFNLLSYKARNCFSDFRVYPFFRMHDIGYFVLIVVKFVRYTNKYFPTFFENSHSLFLIVEIIKNKIVDAKGIELWLCSNLHCC